MGNVDVDDVNMIVNIPENRSAFRHAIRGLTELPHMGPHPGIFFCIFWIIVTGLCCIPHSGLIGFIGGMVLSSLIYIPILIAGSIDRSRMSDRLERLRYEQFERILLNE